MIKKPKSIQSVRITHEFEQFLHQGLILKQYRLELNEIFNIYVVAEIHNFFSNRCEKCPLALKSV